MDIKEEQTELKRRWLINSSKVIGVVIFTLVLAFAIKGLNGQSIGGKVLLPPNLTTNTIFQAPSNFTITNNYLSHHPSHWTGVNQTWLCGNQTIFVEFAEPTLNFSWWTNAIVYNSSRVTVSGRDCIFKAVSGNVR